MRRLGGSAVACLLLLLATACDSEKPDAEDAATRVVARLETLPPGPTREAIAAVTLNAMCTIGRLGAGVADGRVETAVASLVASQPDDIRARLVDYRETLAAIPEAKRAELLGGLGTFDPATCSSAPAWDRLRTGVLFSNQPIPHLRFNFCSNNFSYPDGEPGGRAITVGSMLTAILHDPDGVNAPTHVLASLATPSFTGIELGGGVFARDPALAATGGAGEGISPYGVDTGIPCSGNSNVCNASLGQMCMGTCMAFPVVKKDATIVLRGYNLWDVTDARLVFEPLIPGQGSESTTVIRDFDTNEPSDQVAACTLPSAPQSASFNRAHFRVPANEGAFYKLRLFNHNGTFLTQADGVDDGEPRVIHTCFPPSPVADNVPPGTVRDCTPPVETCVQDGLPCAAAWAAPPRKLDDCRHQPGQTPPCGETPEWYEAELLSPRVQGPKLMDDPIVFVEGSTSPVFTLSGTLHALATIDETGFQSFFGSDEPIMALFGADLDSTAVPDPEDLGNVYKGEDYDDGDRDIVDKLLTQEDLPADGELTFMAVLVEDDGFLGAFLAGRGGHRCGDGDHHPDRRGRADRRPRRRQRRDAGLGRACRQRDRWQRSNRRRVLLGQRARRPITDRRDPCPDLPLPATHPGRAARNPGRGPGARPRRLPRASVRRVLPAAVAVAAVQSRHLRPGTGMPGQHLRADRLRRSDRQHRLPRAAGIHRCRRLLRRGPAVGAEAEAIGRIAFSARKAAARGTPPATSGRTPPARLGRAAPRLPPRPRRRSPRTLPASPSRAGAPAGGPQRGSSAARSAAGIPPWPLPRRVICPSSQKSTSPSMTWIASSSPWWTCSGGPSPAAITLSKAPRLAPGAGDARWCSCRRAIAASARDARPWPR